MQIENKGKIELIKKIDEPLKMICKAEEQIIILNHKFNNRTRKGEQIDLS